MLDVSTSLALIALFHDLQISTFPRCHPGRCLPYPDPDELHAHRLPLLPFQHICGAGVSNVL